MVEGRAGRKLKSWWRIKLEKSLSHGGGEGWKRPVSGHSPWPPGRVATNFLSGTAHLQLLQPQYAPTSQEREGWIGNSEAIHNSCK